VTAPRVVGLSIPADESQPVAVVVVAQDLPAFRQYIGAPGVASWLEVVPVGAVDLWVDEDGHANDLPHNRRASVLSAGHALGGDDMRGDVLALGRTAAGTEASLTVDDLARLGRLLGVEVTA